MSEFWMLVEILAMPLLLLLIGLFGLYATRWM